MKKNNNEGFVLAEAIIVGVFILSLFTFLFVNIVPLVGRYDAVKKYDTIESVYNTNLIRMLILENNNANSYFTGVKSTHPYDLYTPEEFCSKLNNTGEDAHSAEFCDKLLSSTYLNVKSIIITRFRLGNSGNSSGYIKASNQIKNLDRAQREYIKSLDNYTQPSSGTYENYHRIIVEYNDGSFANLEIKK